MRYIRQEILKEIGKKGQKLLSKKTVAIVGVGGLGTFAAELLARAGIGNLILVDRDIVELSNLQRQTLFTEEDIGKPKVIQAEIHLKKINSDLKIKALAIDLNNLNIGDIKSDLILDCTDNLETRYLINEYCLQQKIPWVHASCIKNVGEILSLLPGRPCFKCIYRNAQSSETCAQVGILNTTVVMTAALQANEAMKILLDKVPCENLIRLDIWKPEMTSIKLSHNPKCSACNGKFKYLSGEILSKTVKLCAADTYQVTGKAIDLNNLAKRLQKIGNVKSHPQYLQFQDITVFYDGHALIKASSHAKAKTKYAKYIGS